MLHAPLHARLRRSPHSRLRRLLAARIAPQMAITDNGARDWASASFTGERHRFTCVADGALVIAELRAALAEADWRLPGHIVADVTVEADGSRTEGRTLLIEILTVAD